jgi:hypothetical protein
MKEKLISRAVLIAFEGTRQCFSQAPDRFASKRGVLKLGRYHTSSLLPSQLYLLSRKAHSSIQATGTPVAASTGGVSALSVISLRRNGISRTSTMPNPEADSVHRVKPLMIDDKLQDLGELVGRADS